MKVQNSQNMNIFQEDMDEDQYSDDDDQGQDYEEDYTNDNDDYNNVQPLQESYDDYQDNGDLLFISKDQKPSKNKDSDHHIFNEPENLSYQPDDQKPLNDYEFDDKQDFLAKGQKKKHAVNPMNTINASKQCSNISPPSAVAGRETLNEDQLGSIKTSQRIIDEPVRDLHQDNKENQDIDSVEKLPKPEMTQSPKRTKGNKHNTKIQNPPEEVLKQQQIQNEAQKSKEGVMNQISQAELNLKPHERKIGQYILGKTIGEGTFGKVKIGMHILTKAKVAVKILEKSKIVDVADVERVSREIHILKIVQHPQVVQLYEIIETQKKLYLIMEYASGGELFDYIVKHQRVQEKEACKFFQQLLSGIEYISRLNIVHRDLKPENLLLDFDKGIKIVDFGLSNTYKTGELLKTACGSPCYAAPEMIAGKKYNGTNVDIWSCGVILFALICGYLPFEDPNTSDLYKKILSADFQTPNYVSDEAKDLFHCILNTDPEKRYTIDQIRKHPWFNIVPCESTFKGIKVGIDPVPIDNSILDRMQEDYSIDKGYARKCIQANKHNHISASYYLLLKDLIRKGEKSIADVRSPDYNPQLFLHTAKAIRLQRKKDKLQKQGSQDEDLQAINVEQEPDVMAGTQSSKTNAQRIEKNERDKDINLVRVATENITTQIAGRRESQTNAGTNALDQSTTTQAERGKSTQPQRLRKIADGLLEFERYADRKKRLQSITQKKQDDDRVKNMNMQLSQNQIAEDMLSNGGGLALLQRGLSPVGADTSGIGGHETMSFDQGDPNMMFNQNYRDNSPSLSPHSIRMNAQKGNMSTQYGNFLYQVEAKQFPNQKGGNGTQNRGQLDQFQLSALKNQMHIQALQASNMNPNAPNINVNQMNAKQIHKQLKQLYQHQKKQNGGKGQNNNGKLTNQEIMLKNLVNMSGDHQNSNLSQASKIHQLQQNYQKQQFQGGKKQGGQNFSTIQTAYDTLQNQQTLMANHHMGKSKKSSGGHPQGGMNGHQQLGLASLASGGIMAHHASGGGGSGVPGLTSSTPGGGTRVGISGLHNRYTTQQYNANPAFNTLQQHIGPGVNGSGTSNTNQFSNSATGAKHRSNHKYSTHSTFFNPNTLQSGSRLGAQSNLQPKGAKRSKNATVTGSGSLGPGGGIFSPKNVPLNSFGFGFGNSMFNSNVTTPQHQAQHSQVGMVNPQQHHMFTIDSPGTAQNFSNQLMNSLQGGQQPPLGPSGPHAGNSNVMGSLNVNAKQNSQPVTNPRPNIGSKKRGSSIINGNNQKLQQSNNTISYAPTQAKQLQDVQSQQSQQSNKALFKRRRDHSKGAQKNANQNQNKSAQKYQQQYGTIQAGEGTGRGLATGSSQRNQMSLKQSNHSKNNLSINVNNSNKPPLNIQQQTGGDNSVQSHQRSQPASQKKINKSRTGVSKNQGRSQQPNGQGAGQNLNDISMKRIIETGQNMANLNLNLNMSNNGMGNLPGTVSAKNQNLFSPVGGPAQNNQSRRAALMANGNLNQVGLNSVPMSPQQQKQLQFQQHQEHLNNLNRIQHQLQLKKQQRANLLNMRNTSTNLDVKNNANTSEFQTQSFIKLQQNSVTMDQQPNVSPQGQNPKVTLNSSLLAQNYAPHLLLQNYHGNGYPPLTQQALKSPQNNIQAQQQFSQNIQPQVGQSSIKTTQSRRKTPQIHTAGGAPQQQSKLTSGNNNLSQTPNSQVKPSSLQNSININNNFVSNYSNNMGAKQWQQQQNQQQFPLSAKNSSNQNVYQQFGGGNSQGLAPINLDSSNIDYQDDVMDISNNTIANINQQLGGSKTHILQQPAPQQQQPQVTQATPSVRKKSRGGGAKKRSIV